MPKMSIHRKRIIFMFLFTAFFGVVSWLYFYFSFFNFFTFNEDQYIIDGRDKTVYVTSEPLFANIPKKGIKINTDKYEFDKNKSTLESNQNYSLTFKNQQLNLVVVDHPLIALHIIGFNHETEEQNMRWELKRASENEVTGYGKLIKSHYLLDGKDLELRFFQDSLFSRPLELNVFDTVSSTLNLISLDHEFEEQQPQSKNKTFLFINGVFEGSFEVHHQ